MLLNVNHSGQLRDISEVREAGVKSIPQFHHSGPFTHPLSSNPSADHKQAILGTE